MWLCDMVACFFQVSGCFWEKNIGNEPLVSCGFSSEEEGENDEDDDDDDDDDDHDDHDDDDCQRALYSIRWYVGTTR